MKIDIQEFLNQNSFSKLQWLIFLLMFLVAFFDGMDTAMMGYVAPSILKEWQLSKAQLIPVLSAALLGAAIGAIIFGPLADKIGRKKTLILAVLVFSIPCVLSAFAQNIYHLEILRFITGLGLGAAMPNAVTLLSEFCPDRRRAILVNTMYCGFPIGAAIGGFAAAWIIPIGGWKMMFYLCGGIPLFLCILMIFVLPESVRYLIIKGKNHEKIKTILSKINQNAQRYTQFILHDTQNNLSHHPIRVILSSAYLCATLCLWLSFFCGLMIFYSIINWMPILFQQMNMSVQLGSIVSGLFALGGLGAIVNGWFMDRFNGNLVIAFCTFITAVAVALIGPSMQWSLLAFILVIILAGTMQNTAQSSLPVLAANFYPTIARSTGVAWMCGIGRFGAVAGTTLMGILVSHQLSFTEIFTVLSIPAIVMTLCLLIKNLFFQENKKMQTIESLEN